MNLTTESTQVRLASESLYFEGRLVRLKKKGGKNSRVVFEDMTEQVVPNSSLSSGKQEPEQDLEDDESNPYLQNPVFQLTPVKPSDVVQRQGYSYPTFFEEAVKTLHGQGFRETGDAGDKGRSTLYVFLNDLTGQRANLSLYHKDEKGRPMERSNEAKITYHLVKSQRPTRRTPEKKYRDNYVKYD